MGAEWVRRQVMLTWEDIEKAAEVIAHAKHRIDRSNWGKGPWDNEPDFEVFQICGAGWNYLGIVRRLPMGNLSGYVMQLVDDPCYNFTMNDCSDLDVHGGVTFGNTHPDIANLTTVQFDNLWFIGFDCGHANDFTPGLDNRLHGYHGTLTYRDWKFVKQQVISLAEQIAKLK